MAESKEEFSGLTEEEIRLIQVIRNLGLKPEIKGAEGMAKVAHAFSDYSGKEEEEEKHSGYMKKPAAHSYPKFSIFYGEDGKGEVTYDTFKFEVLSVIAEDIFSPEQVMFGIRRAVKGKASDKIRRLGIGADPEFVLKKLDSDYGTVENKETALKKFYTCKQKPNESVETFATRLEELFYKAVELKAFDIANTEILKQVFHSGLKKDLKQMSVYQRDTIKKYDDFKKELRKMESEMADKPDSDDKKPCKPAVNADKRENSEITQLLKQLNERIDRLEKGQKQQEDSGDDQQQWYSRRGLGRGRWRGATRGRGDFRGHGAYGRGSFRGRGTYRPQRPFASGTFAPTCYLCNRKGHVQMNCPTILAQLECFHCKEKGHMKRDCPNL